MYQLEKCVAGDKIATIITNMGEIKIKLFPEYAPKAVENFVTHAQEGYYNGLIFHRVINNFMIQGGDPNGTGTGGESIWGEPCEDAFTPELHNLRGALSMANAGPSTNGSQ
ncbi:MAG: peptidylprolyl isomerase, partial [Oscillospiraceae bacterium]|nr:peptidylprolyl isomerase [Oscillospiraceae bacterium]